MEEVTRKGLLDADRAGATPLTAEDLDGLIPDLTTREELNAWEQENILQALNRLRKRKPKEILDDAFLKKLHGWMFGETWAWAGEYRRRETNIGIEPARIAVATRQLCDNYRFQRDNNSFGPEELSVRFHRDLVWIHPFANGNGRHSRLAADLLLASLSDSVFSWGGGTDLENASDARDEYLAALREADNGDFARLIAFACS